MLRAWNLAAHDCGGYRLMDIGNSKSTISRSRVDSPTEKMIMMD